jgi:vacuolar protein sorting-associated protein 52
MIRLNEAAYQEVGRRGCGPMEAFLLGIRIKLWPLFQSEMGAHVESLKKLADSATGTMLSRGSVRDTVVRAVSRTSSIWLRNSTEPRLGCSALRYLV